MINKILCAILLGPTLKVVLNLSDVPFTDEVGTGELIGNWTHVKKQAELID